MTTKTKTTETTGTTTNAAAKTASQCGDGCGQKANVGRSYLPGHDAKLASVLRKVAEGEVAREDLPALVKDRLAKGHLALPAPRTQFVQFLVAVTVGVPVEAEDAEGEAKRRLTARLNGLRWEVKAPKAKETAKVAATA